MIRVVNAMSDPLRRTPLVQEQLAFGLNRAGRGEDAERVLLQLIESRGPNSETYGLLGRVYKDRWEAALKNGEKILARGLLDKAIDAYVKGFETDWRDAYPDSNISCRLSVMPLSERSRPANQNYWDYATMLELAGAREGRKRCHGRTREGAAGHSRELGAGNNLAEPAIDSASL
jgi:hypothetical protein